MLRKSILPLLLVAAIGNPVFATEASLQPEVIITAARVVQTVDDTLADVSILTREDIETSVARDISDLLRLQAGIDIARTGGPGAQTSVFLRGTNNNHVLVLVDGVRVASLNTGVFTWETLPLAIVERIEIVRGPRASYWGSDAIGGVIQIFTRKLETPTASLGHGSHGDRQANAGFARRGAQGGFSVQAGARDYDGFPSQNENGFAFEDKDHGLRNRHFSARADQRWGEQSVDASWARTQGTTEFSGGASQFTEQSFNAAWSGRIATHWQHRLAYGHASEDYTTPAFFAQFLTRRDSLGWQNELSAGESQRIVLGIDLVREQGENRDTFGDTTIYKERRENTGIYAGWRTKAGAFDSELALRFDDNSQFGGQWTGGLALGWRFSDTTRAYASHGLGFRGPTLNEQYSPGFGGLFSGNSDLRPEKSRSSEVGLEFVPGEGQLLKASWFNTHVRNLISFSGVDFRAENIDSAHIPGVEVRYEKRAGSWLVASSYTWQDPRNEETDSPLLRRPGNKVAASVDRQLGSRGLLGAELMHAGARDDLGGVRLPAYTLINLRASWSLAPRWKLSARLENAGDRDYELAHGYNTPGRSGFVEIVWTGD
jgi:vitamin B12 transporter